MKITFCLGYEWIVENGGDTFNLLTSFDWPFKKYEPWSLDPSSLCYTGWDPETHSEFQEKYVIFVATLTSLRGIIEKISNRYACIVSSDEDGLAIQIKDYSDIL